MKARSQSALTLSLLMTLLGCTVAPQYVEPRTPPIELASPQAAQFDTARAFSASAQWWGVFEDPVLTQWIADALAHNHDIRQAQASLLAARAIFDERRLDRLPAVTSRVAYQRAIEQQARADGRPERTLSESWRAGFDMQWEIDLFGRLDRLQQAAQARAEATAAELDEVRLSIAAEVARSYFEAQGTEHRLAVAEQQVANWRETVLLIQARIAAGSGLPEDLENAHSQLLRSEAAIAPLTVTLQQARFRLDVLAGQRPRQGPTELGKPPATPLIRQLPLADVDRLIRHRPDVVRAERLLAASVEDVGAATADLYPRLNLGGFIGFFALRDADLGSAARAFELAPGLTWPALRLGNARARLRASQALSQGALSRYEQVLLRAQEEVENTLTQLSEQQRYLGALLGSAGHAQAAFDIASKRYGIGSGSYMAVLENQRALFQARDDIAKAQTGSYLNLIAFYKALGWRPN